MLRSVVLTVAGCALAATLATADPAIQVTETNGGIRIVLEGNYSQSTYVVWRSDETTVIEQPLTTQEVLCTGDCYASDFDVVPGRTYFYRFEIRRPDGVLEQFGPYAVVLPDHPVSARLIPNPGRGVTRLELSLPGGARENSVVADARLVDVQGRAVRSLFHGTLARGVTPLSWDGRDDRGQTLGAGLYFLRFSSPLGASVTRVLRIR